MSYVIENESKCRFGKTFERSWLGREKKLGGNFGSEESLEAEKRPGTIFGSPGTLQIRGNRNRRENYLKELHKEKSSNIENHQLTPLSKMAPITVPIR